MVGTFDFKAGRYEEKVYGGNRIETKTTARCTVVDSNVGQKKKDQGAELDNKKSASIADSVE
jgi:hypothetical protein